MSEPVQQKIGNVALVVENYDDAIDFYTQKLQFVLVEDTDLGSGKRWVQISPPSLPREITSRVAYAQFSSLRPSPEVSTSSSPPA